MHSSANWATFLFGVECPFRLGFKIFWSNLMQDLHQCECQFHWWRSWFTGYVGVVSQIASASHVSRSHSLTLFCALSVRVLCCNCSSLPSFTLCSSAQPSMQGPSMQGLWEPGTAPVMEDPQSYNIFGTSSIWGPVQENRAAVPWMTALKTPESSPSLGEGRDKKGKFPESSPFE